MQTRVMHSIMIDTELAGHSEVIQMKQNKNFSDTINQLLRGYLRIQKSDLPKDMAKIKAELLSIEGKKSKLLEKQAELLSKQPTLSNSEIQAGWFIINGKKYQKIKGQTQ